MKKKSLLPQIAAPVERLPIASVRAQSNSQGVEPAIHWGFAVEGVPFATDGDN